MYKRNAQGWSKHLDFFIIDEIVLQISFILGCLIRHGIMPYKSQIYMNLSFILVLIDAIVLMMLNTMHNVVKRGYYKELTSTVRHCAIVFGLATIYLFATQSGDNYSRIILVLTLAFHVIIGYLSRITWKKIITDFDMFNGKKTSMLVILDPETADRTMTSLQANNTENYEIVGVVLKDNPEGLTEYKGVPIVASICDASNYICREWIDSVYIDCSSTDPIIAQFMMDCREMAVPVHYHVPGMSRDGSKRFVERIGGTTVLTTSINYATPVQAFMKRTIDIVGGIVGSIIAVLIILIIGPIIKIQSPGPILFKQERIGKNGKRFKMLKLRSMYMDAEERKQELMSQNRVSDGMMFKMDFDPRIIGNKVLPDGTQKTGLGAFIRKTSLDEFPQFFNVLAGQMSLVGTRPPTVDEWEKYKFHHRARLACKPGITGIWQVSGRSNITDFEEVVKLDTEYVTDWSMGMDFKILFKTIFVLFGDKGAM